MTHDPAGDHKPADVARAAQDAVSTFVQTVDPGAMPGPFTLLVEVVDAAGRQALWSATAPEQAPWTTLGHLEHGRQSEQAAARAGEH